MPPIYQHIQRTMRQGQKIPAVILLLVMVIFIAGTAGCIKHIQKTAGGDAEATLAPDSVQNHNSPVLQPAPTGTPATVKSPSAASVPVASVTVQQSAQVQEVAPILPDDPYPIIHGVRVNAAPVYAFLNRTPEFKKTYTLRGNATGLLVNVAQGPLYIVFKVNPEYDCLSHPESCRGTLAVPVNRPYLTITVRDNRTQAIVAEDGYAREYSSDNGHYRIEVISKKDSTTSTPGPRYIPVYAEGTFHITVEGNYLDVEISIITGSSPDPLERATNAGTAMPATPLAAVQGTGTPRGW